MKNSHLPVAIIGAGPIGLAAAANLLERDIDFVIFERGETVAASVRSWAHVRLFSPFSSLIDPAARRLLAAAGWREPLNPAASPTGAQLIESYLEPLAQLEPIASRLRAGSIVVAVSRLGKDRTRTAGRAEAPFVLRVSTIEGTEDVLARAVIDASGTLDHPNSLGSSGIEPIGIDEVRDSVVGALPDVLGADRARFAGKRVAVVGAGHSAVNTLIALASLPSDSGTQILWVIRNERAVRVFTPESDELADRVSLGARVQELVEAGSIEVVDGFELGRLSRSGDAVRVSGERGGETLDLDVDVVVNATGFRPNLRLLGEIRLDMDEVVEAPRRLAPLIDPNVHSCATVRPHGVDELRHPEPDFFIAGMKSYGRAPTFLLATGHEQVRSIVAHLAGDEQSARRIELTLTPSGACTPSAAICC